MTGQHDVEHHQVEAAAQRRFQAAAAIVLAFDRETFAAEEFLEQRAKFGVIINDEYPHGSNVSRWQGFAQ